MISALQAYLARLNELRQNSQATAELSLRPALDELFQTLKPAQVEFVGEGKQLAIGRPDFTFTRKPYNDPIGYVEAEKISADLGNLAGHAKTQNERFSADLDNFLLTNHLDFRLYDGGTLVERVTLPEKAGALSDKHEAGFARLWERFTSAEIAAPQTPKELANLLARRARTLRLAINDALSTPGSPLEQDLEAFRKLLLPDLSTHDFANLYAETLTYGLFAARCQNPDSKPFKAQTADRALKRTPLLRTLYRLFEADIDANLEWVLDNMAAILGSAAIDEIRAYFSNRSGRPDPMIDFYEPFLAQYDPKARQSRGVYYTPEPVVSYIVRSVHALLQSRFDMETGVAGGAKILDPATGTGSFLFAVLDQMHREIGPHDWPSFMRDKKPLDNLFGFELMVAPYTVAHLKLALQLEGLSTPLAETERLNIFLTNTLDDARRQSEALLEGSIADEVNAAADVKEKTPILVVLGNPPYAGHSSNSATKMVGDKREFTRVGQQIDSYKFIDGVSLGERNSKWLQDDYVKFLAFAQKRIEDSGEGIVAFITNHGYLDNPTFRGMRKSLLETFTTLYLLDLHGNAKKKEVAPDGSADKNVFDIQQGVSIILAVKEKGKTGAAKVFHADLWGSREEKYSDLNNNDVTTTQWQVLEPSAPLYLFAQRDEELLPEYEKGWKVTDIFPVNVLGFQTHRDHFAISFTCDEMKSRIEAMRSDLSDKELSEQFSLKDNRDWQISNARKKVRGEQWESKITLCDYRPFDRRFCYFDDSAMDYPRRELVQNVFGKENLVLNVTRQTRTEEWRNAVVSLYPTPALFVEIKDGSNAFPLYLYSDSLFGSEKLPNISDKYLAELTQRLGTTSSPEAIFGYTYAVLHSPVYRRKYAAFLKTDFPRVPLPASPAHFNQFAVLGTELVALHTLDSKAAPVLKEKRHKLSAGSDSVEKPRYEAAERRIYINEAQWFHNVDAETYHFKIGGYTVADKWLSDRKGRTLSFDERRLYPQILIALSETRRIMEEIEKLDGV